jgi:hypothetical protein
MTSLRTLVSTCSDYWPRILDSLLPPVAGLLSATALWVASRARGTSRDAQSTSQGALSLSLLHSVPPDSSGSESTAPAQRSASSTTAAPASTSTSRGDQGRHAAPEDQVPDVPDA